MHGQFDLHLGLVGRRDAGHLAGVRELRLDAAAAKGGTGRVVLIGIAQEKALVRRSWKAKG